MEPIARGSGETEGLQLVRDPITGKLLLLDKTADNRFASDVKIWNESAIPPPVSEPAKRPAGRPKKAMP